MAHGPTGGGSLTGAPDPGPPGARLVGGAPCKARLPDRRQTMNTADARRVLETALICAQQPLPVRELRVLFRDELGADTIKELLGQLQQEWTQRGVELVC